MIHKLRRMLVITLSLGLLVVVLGSLPVGAADTTVDVNPADISGIPGTTDWFTLNLAGSATSAIVTGPGTPPLGTGSLQMTTSGTTDKLNVFNLDHDGVKLADITHLEYSTYGNSNLLAITLQMTIDPDGAAGTGVPRFGGGAPVNFATLNFEPYNDNTITPNTWQTWNALTDGAAIWASNIEGDPGNGNNGRITNPATWAEFVAFYPDAEIIGTTGLFGVNVGSNWSSAFTGHVDAIKIGYGGDTVTYNFDPAIACTTICYADAVNGNDLNGGSSPTDAKKTIQAAVNAVNTNGQVIVAAGVYPENVTIPKSLTLTGAGQANDATGTVLEGTGRNGSGIFINNNVTDVTVENLRVQNYNTTPAAGVYANLSNHRLTVQNITSVNNGTTGTNGGGIYMNGPVNQVLITGNTITNNRSRGIVIWNGFKTNITITDNTVTGNNCCGIELQDGTASGVTVTGNTVSGNADSGMAFTGLMAGAGPNLIAENTVTNNGRFGIEIKLPNGTGLPTGDGSIVVEDNTVSLTTLSASELRDIGGIVVFRRGWVSGNNNVDIPTGVIVRDNTVSGYSQTNAGTLSTGFGIVVEGTNMTVTGNTLNNNDVGAQTQAGHLPYVANTNTDGNQNNVADLYFGRGNSPVGCADLSDNTFNGNTTTYRTIVRSSTTPPNPGTIGGTVTNLDTGEVFCSIQEAIDDDDTEDEHTLQLSAGTFVPTSTIVVDKSLTIIGPQAGIDPRPSNGSTRDGTDATTEAIVTGSGLLNGIIRITADDVTLDGFVVTNGNSDLIYSLADSDIQNLHIKNLIVYDALDDEGIQIRDCDECAITFNYVYNTKGDGINLCCQSTKGLIAFNDLKNIDSPDAAIFVYEAYNTEINCNVVDTTTRNDGIKLEDPLQGDLDWGGKVTNNRILNTLEDGIAIYVNYVQVSGNEITGSTSQNGGIYVSDGATYINIYANHIHNNTFVAGKWVDPAGIMIGNSGSQAADTIQVFLNNIVGNSVNGVSNHGTGTLFAQENWWGAADGPGPVGPGSGDKVSTNVSYLNWLQEPYDIPQGACDLGGTITVTKVAEGAEDLEFTFDYSWDEQNDLVLTDGQWETSDLLPPGTYSVEEIDIPNGWVLSEASCEPLMPARDIPETVSPDEIPVEHDVHWLCTFVNVEQTVPPPLITLTPSYLVSRVVEGQLSGEGSRACYWITLSSEPSDDVIIDIDPDGLAGEVVLSKSQVTLNASNWNNLSTTDNSNFVCARAFNDSVDEPEPNAPICGDKSADMTSDSGAPYSTQECGDHVEFVEHRVNASTPATTGYDQSTPWENRTLSDNDRPAENYLEVLLVDNDTAEVRITESFAITDLDEGGSPVGRSCYWVTLGSRPLNTVTIDITPGPGVATDKSQVVLDDTNWNVIDNTLADKTNMVCVTPIDNDDIDAGPDDEEVCHTGSNTMLGQPGTGTEKCGTHLSSISHSVSSADPKYTGAPFRNMNGPDFDNDQSTLDVIIRDDDVADVLSQPSTLNLMAGAQATLNVSLASKPKANVYVSSAMIDTELVFQPSNWNVPQKIVINAPGITGSTPETLRFEYNLKSDDPRFHNLVSGPVEVTVIPESVAGVLLSSTTVSVSEAGQTSTYDLALTSKPKTNVQVALSTDGQLTVSPATLQFTPENWNQPRRVTVRAVDDQIAESQTHQGHIYHNVTSVDSDYQGLAVSNIIVDIADNDVAAVVASRSALAVSEDGRQQATYDVVLQSRPTASVVVKIDGGGQVTATPAVLTFTQANWDTPQAVQVQAVDDDVAEGAIHTTSLTHKTESADPFYNGYEPTVSVTVTDNDIAGVALSQATLNVGVGQTATYTIVLTSRPTSGVAIDLVAGGNASATGASCQDSDGNNDCVLFTPDNWNVPQTVTVRASGAGSIGHVVTSPDQFYQALNVHSVMVNTSFMLFLPLSQGN